ncbi:MAG: hypothetical protein ABIU05_23265 [Nitrospirales bacterium]
MNLPRWVEESLNKLPNDFQGRMVITINCWAGGVTNLEISTTHQAPKGGEMKRDDPGQPLGLRVGDRFTAGYTVIGAS